MLLKMLSDPKIFNYVIMSLYGLNAGRWLLAGSYADCAYWCGALWITLAVTFGYTR